MSRTLSPNLKWDLGYLDLKISKYSKNDCVQFFLSGELSSFSALKNLSIEVQSIN